MSTTFTPSEKIKSLDLQKQPGTDVHYTEMTKGADASNAKMLIAENQS